MHCSRVKQQNHKSEPLSGETNKECIKEIDGIKVQFINFYNIYNNMGTFAKFGGCIAVK